jgi:hypothetical protein
MNQVVLMINTIKDEEEKSLIYQVWLLGIKIYTLNKRMTLNPSNQIP